MKSTLYAGALLSAMVGTNAAADCGGLDGTLQVVDPALLALYLNGHILCATAASGPDQWSSEHPSSGTSGTFYEMAKGTDPVDPRHQAGNWTVKGALITTQTCYDYTGDQEYCYNVYLDVISPSFGNTGKLCTAGTSTLIASFTRIATPGSVPASSPCFPP